MKNKIRLLIATSRPISWVNTAYPFAVGYLLMGGGIDARLIIGSLFFLIPYNLLMYGVNDVFDFESDMQNPRKGGVEGAITPKRHHPLIIRTSVWLSAPFVVALIVMGNLVSSLTLVAVLFMVVAYSVRGLRFKEVPLLDSVTSSLHFVGPLLFAYSLVGATEAGWLAAAAFFAWGVASQAFGAVQDIVPDRAAGIRSIATQLGAARTMRFAFLIYALAIVLIASLGTQVIFIVIAGLFYLGNIRPYLSLPDDESHQARPAWRRFIYLNYITGAVVTITIVAIQAGYL